MAAIKHEDCDCPGRRKPDCAHLTYRVAYRQAGELREVPFKRLEDAESFAIGVERRKDLGARLDPEAGRRVFADVWREWVEAGALEESTKRNYQSVYDNHFGRTFGSMEMADIAPADIERWEAYQRGRGYAENGVNGRKNVLSSVFNYAVTAEIIGRNPCRKVNPHRRAGRPLTPIGDDDIPAMEEVMGIIAEAPKLIRAGFWAMAGCGLRPGEALAISSASMNWDRGILVVDHQVSAYGCQEISGSRRGVKRGTKSRGSGEARRTPVPHSIRQVFNDHVDAFGMWGDRGWFFESPRQNDRHPSYDWFLAQFKVATTAAGTPRYTPKSFRHFFVSEAIHSGIPLFEIAAWVGHRTTRTTELIYGHLVRRSMHQGALVMHNRLGLDLAPLQGSIPLPSLHPSGEAADDQDDAA
ncbi:tyrosine-type recombinase/integrase [Streptomyces sp. NPDC051658]|uniref:tyrosine-type recombinase/integrase n=1 Tax=Streptomyces sp. NPDC051658 TaxID=3365667 RepID=UPI0037938A62